MLLLRHSRHRPRIGILIGIILLLQFIQMVQILFTRAVYLLFKSFHLQFVTVEVPVLIVHFVKYFLEILFIFSFLILQLSKAFFLLVNFLLQSVYLILKLHFSLSRQALIDFLIFALFLHFIETFEILYFFFIFFIDHFYLVHFVVKNVQVNLSVRTNEVIFYLFPLLLLFNYDFIHPQ